MELLWVLLLPAIALAQTIHEDCLLEPDPGRCRAYMPRYFYNSTTASCERFIYSGCQGNENKFTSKEECAERCMEERIVSRSAWCAEPLKVGLCRAVWRRYFFNATLNHCDSFIYSGCRGNNNNFRTMDQCMSECPPV